MLLNCGVREDSWESLGLQEDPTDNPKGNQSWMFVGRTECEAETPILWPPDMKNWLIGKDPDDGKDWRQEKKGMTAAHQASLSITNSWSLLKFMFIELVMPSNHLILCRPLLPLPSIFPSLFRRVSSSSKVAKVLGLQFQQQFFQWIFRVDFL